MDTTNPSDLNQPDQNTIPAEPAPEPMVKPKKWKMLPYIIGTLSIAVFTFAALRPQIITSQAASKRCQIIARVMINPGEIKTTTTSKYTEMSALAYDAAQKPIRDKINYEWGISSINSIGTIKPHHDLATFKPKNVGSGDLYIKAHNSCTKQPVIGSILVTVDQGTVTPTPTKSKIKFKPTIRDKENPRE